MSQQSKHLDSRGRLPQITGEVARDSAEMLDGLGFRSLSDFLTAASWAYRRGLFQGTFYPIAVASEVSEKSHLLATQSNNVQQASTEAGLSPRPKDEYSPMLIEDGFIDDDDDDDD